MQEHGVQPRRVSTKITLSAPKPKQLKLKMGSTTPTPHLPLVAGTTVDSEALRRQKEETAQALSRATRGMSRTYTNGSTPIPAVSTNLRRSVSVSDAQGTRSDQTNGQASTPAPAPVQTKPAQTMPAPPPGPANIPTPAVVVDPVTLQPPVAINGAARVQTQQTPRNSQLESSNPIERSYRDPGKGIDDALLASVTYMTHPHLPSDPKWRLTRYASAEKTQTSYSIYLPITHSYLRLIPTITKEFLTRRNRKMVVSVDWRPLEPVQGLPADATPVYDFPLKPGQNVVAVDVISELKEGDKKDYAPPQLQIDFERIVFHIYMRDGPE